MSVNKAFMNDSINITYTPATGDIEFTTARKTSSLDEAVAAIGDYIRTLKAEPVKQPAEVRAHEPKVKPAKAKRPRHLWTDEEKREAMRMYAEGVDMDVIVEKFQSTPMSVQKIMQKNGIRRPWPTKGSPSQVKTDEPKEEPV
jgi:hypothetical protein